MESWHEKQYCLSASEEQRVILGKRVEVAAFFELLEKRRKRLRKLLRYLNS
jgi:hypothetical protein